VWQQFLDERPDRNAFDFLTVAVDAEPSRVAEYAGPHSFPTAVDQGNLLGRLFDFDVVPNGLFIDERGRIQFLHVGGFYLHRPEIRAQVEALLAADFAAGERPSDLVQESPELEELRAEVARQPHDPDLLTALGDALMRDARPREAADAYRQASDLRPDDWSPAFGLGTALRACGDRDGALRNWRRALDLDPHNFTVRKQIWREEHPERFYPTIDAAWQKEQLQREGYTPG
jgi:tetratricopeptide (TPR) repeat protein